MTDQEEAAQIAREHAERAANTAALRGLAPAEIRRRVAELADRARYRQPPAPEPGLNASSLSREQWIAAKRRLGITRL